MRSSSMLPPLATHGVTTNAQGTLTSMEAVEAIVMAKHKERLAGLEKEKQEVAARHDEKLRLAAEEQHALHQDHQLRKVSGTTSSEK